MQLPARVDDVRLLVLLWVKQNNDAPEKQKRSNKRLRWKQEVEGAELTLQDKPPGPCWGQRSNRCRWLWWCPELSPNSPETQQIKESFTFQLFEQLDVQKRLKGVKHEFGLQPSDGNNDTITSV